MVAYGVSGFAADSVTVGATLEIVTVAVSLTGELIPSSAVSVAVYTPSSVQVTMASVAAASANVHAASSIVQCADAASLSSAIVPSSATAEPSLPAMSSPASDVG